MDRKDIFINAYNTNHWKGRESRSGKGSDIENTLVLQQKLIEFINSRNIKTFIDAPCGTMNWQKFVIPYLIIEKYIGIDIVPEMIETNKQKYGNHKITFECRDLVEDFPKEGDLLLCRDCLVHLSWESSLKILKNFANSNIKYLLATTFNRDINHSGKDGEIWYPMDLTKLPFTLPTPKININEECMEEKGQYKDKSLGLWIREEIKNVVSQ